jgi:hypothetical protein
LSGDICAGQVGPAGVGILRDGVFALLDFAAHHGQHIGIRRHGICPALLNGSVFYGGFQHADDRKLIGFAGHHRLFQVGINLGYKTHAVEDTARKSEGEARFPTDGTWSKHMTDMFFCTFLRK